MMQLASIVIVSLYYSRHRALATSVVLCGSCVGKIVFARLSRCLVDEYGWRGANCILAAIVLHGAACGCVFRPVRVEAAAAARSERRPRRPAQQTGCVLMQKMIAEKRRRRCESTGSLDGTVITSDGQLLRHNENGNGQALSRMTSAGSGSASDSASTDRPVHNGQHNPSDQPSSSTAAVSTGRSRTVSSTDASLRTLSLCTNDGHVSSMDRLSSATCTALQTVSADHADSPTIFSDRVTIDPDSEVVPDPSETSVVWVLDNDASVTLNCSRTELSESERCSNLIEMTDLLEHRPPSLLHRPPSVTQGPPSTLAPLSSRPDIVYTGNLQVRLIFFH